MKYIGIALLIACGGITVVAQGAESVAPIKRDITETAPYKMRVSLFEDLTEHRDIVMLGDSLTARGEWAELAGSGAVANRGIGGDTTTGMLARLGPIKAMKPKAVFIMAGINDLGRGVQADSVISNYEKIIEDLHRSGASVYVQSTLHVNRKSRLKNNKSITAINVALKSYCEQANNCKYIDLNHSLSESAQLKKEMSLDGIHLTGEGYMAWSKVITPYLNEVLRK